MNLGFSGASRWSASESFLGGYLFDRNYGNFSTGVDNEKELIFFCHGRSLYPRCGATKRPTDIQT